MSLLCRKTLTFQDLGAHLEKLLAEDNVAEDGKGHSTTYTYTVGSSAAQWFTTESKNTFTKIKITYFS